MPRISSKLGAELVALAVAITQYSSRWYHFELSCPTKFATLFQLKGSHAPIRESLRLELSGHTKFLQVTCPRLQKVHLVSVQLLSFPWNNVTHICAHSMFLRDYLEILENTPLLVHAEVMNVGRLELPPRRPNYHSTSQVA